MGVGAIVRGSFVGTLTVAACQQPCDELPPSTPVDPGPLHIERGRFLDAMRVELAFSRPLAPVDGVDPAKFRLAVARGDTDEYGRKCLSTTYYCELSLGLSDGGCGRCYTGYDSPDPDACPSRIEVVSLVRDDADPRLLQLELSAPIRPLLCLQLGYTDGDAIVQVHYSALDIPTITDEAGVALGDISPRWVLEGLDEEYHEHLFPNRDALVPIPCPEDFG